MKTWRRLRHRLFSIPLMLMVIAAVSIGPVTTALAQGRAPRAQAQTGQAPPPIEPFAETSDPRATFFDHRNITTCTGAPPSGLGLTGVIQVGTSPKSNGGPVTDGPITYTIRTNNLNTSTWGTNTAALIDITVAPGTTVAAVVVKGGDGSNVYFPPNVPNTETIAFRSPLNNGGKLPTISHWFICYQFSPPPPTDDNGNISVSKTVIGPGGVPVTPLPTSYSATVNCGGAGTQAVTFPGAGGSGNPTPALSDLPAGSSCTVTEGTTPPNAVVTYSVNGGLATPTPPTVAITAGSNNLVTITNDFSNAPIEMGTLNLEKVVTNPGGASLPADWTAQVHCDAVDSDLTTTVTMPGAGGAGTPVLHPDIGAGCSVQEFDIPAGWSVTYTVNGVTTSTPPFVDIESTTPITVTITNTGPSVCPTPTAPPTPTPKPTPCATPTPSPAPTGPGLPGTGAPPPGGGELPLLAVLMACLAAAAGAGFTIRAVRR